MARLIKFNREITYANSTGADIPAGTPIVIGAFFGVAIAPIPDGTNGIVAGNGVWAFAKASETTANQGAIAYWDATNSVVTATASTNAPIGYFAEAAVSGSTEVAVVLGAGLQAASA